MSESLLIEDVVGSKAFDQLEALELNLDAINAQVEGLVKTFATLGKAVEQVNDIRKLTTAQQQLSKAQTEAVSVTKRQATAQAALAKTVKESTQREQELQKALNTSAKSIKEAREQNKLLTAARNAANVSTKEGVAQLNRLNAKIDQNNAFIKANGDQALRQKLNIGNYASALDGLGGSFGGVVRQGQGFIRMLKGIPGVLGPYVALLGSAVGALKLWITTTAKGEEAAFKFRKELQLIKENFKNNAGFTLSNIIGDADTSFKKTADGLDDIKELSEKTKKSFADWVKMAFIGAASIEGAYQEYAASKRKGLSLEDEIKEAIQRNARTGENYAKRVKQFTTDAYNFERKRIASLTETAALERDIARLLETARDTSKSVEERQAARAAALAKINELEVIELGMAKEQVRLIQEETELTHTLQFDTLRGVDELLAKRKEEAELLRMITDGTDSAEDVEKRRNALTARRVELEKQLKQAEAERATLQDDQATEADQHLIDQAELRLSVLRGQLEAVKEQEKGVRTVAQANERLAQVQSDIERLTELRVEAAKDILANEEKAANGAVVVLKTEEKFANLRKSLFRLGKSLNTEQLADRKALLKEYTDALKQELDNQVAAAKAAADEAKAVYNEKGNEGLNQLEDVRAWIDARNAALDAEQKAEEELVRKTAEKTIEILGLSGEEAAKVTERMEADLLAVQEKYGIKREALANENARAASEAVAGQIQAEQAKITADIQTELDNRQVALSRSFEEGKISYSRYHKEIERSEREALRNRLKAQIEYYEKIMTAEGVTVDVQRKALSDLSRLYKEFNEALNDEDENPTSWWDKMNDSEKAQAVVDKVKETWDAVTAVVSDSIQNQIDAVDNQQRKLDKQYDKRLEQVKNMGLSQRQEELETARIEREHQAETEKLEAQKAALQVKQAKWNKANSIVQAAISGAVAVMQAFAQAGPVAGAVFAAVIAATTAAQIAAIAAQKIPEYRTGRDGGPEELAIVGDGGVPEVIRTRSGKAYITPDKPTLAHLGAGDKVYRSVEDYLITRAGDPAVVGELKAMRKENRLESERMGELMRGMNTRLSVTSAGLAWLKGKHGGAYGRS